MHKFSFPDYGIRRSCILMEPEVYTILFMRNYLVLILLPVLLMSCNFLQDRHARALALAGDGRLTRGSLDAGQFSLTIFYRGLDHQTDILAVYIEGDGYAWQQKEVLSTDPTPVDPVALKLTAKDPSPAVLYIARPCQYLSPEELKACSPKYWSTHRYAEEIIHSVNEAVDWGIRKSGASKINLYGYSGGGAVAALVASRRTDVNRLITVAANLDHVLWTRLHGVSPLSDSLNPADATFKLKDIPQVHFAGSEDKIVPLSILESYRGRFKENTKITLEVIPGFDHHCCWEDSWLDLLLKADRDITP